MKKNATPLLIGLLMSLSLPSFAQIAISSAPGIPPIDPSALLDMQSTSKGMLLPRMTSVQRLAIATPADGLMVYDSLLKSIWYFKAGTGWQQVAPSLLVLPYSATANSASNLFSLTNTGTGGGLEGINSSTNNSVVGVQGVISSTTPGGFSTAVRGVNNGTGGLGIGVWGSQNGSGWGVYGTALGGIGLYGSAGSGTGVRGESSTGVAGSFQVISSMASANALNAATSGIGDAINGTNTNAGSGSGGVFLITSPTNNDTALLAQTSGTGSAAMFIASKTTNTSPATEIRHLGAGNGLNVAMTNATSGATGINVIHTGSGTGIFSASNSGQGVWGLTGSSFSAAVLADNVDHGEAVTGRTSATGNAGFPSASISSVVGRNDSTGVGVKGFATGTTGYGVMGLAGFNTFAGHPGTGVAGRFENLASTNGSDVVQVVSNGSGTGINLDLTNASNSPTGIDVNVAGAGTGIFSVSAGGQGIWGFTASPFSAAVLADNAAGGEAVTGRTSANGSVAVPSSSLSSVVGRNDGTGVGVKGFSTGATGYGVMGLAGFSTFAGHPGTGVAGRFENLATTNGSDVLQVVGNGSGTGINLDLTNASNSPTGIDVFVAGGGTGIFSASAGGQGIWGFTTSSFSAAVLADNAAGGEAVTGRTSANGSVAVPSSSLSSVVGRNDGTGVGVKGFSTGATGYGVMGLAGYNTFAGHPGTGVAGRFENLSSVNASSALEAVTNGTGFAGSFTATGSGQGVSIGVGSGQKALSISSGRVVYATTSYVSGSFPTDATVVACNNGIIASATSVTLPALENGTLIIIVATDPDGVIVTNTFNGVIGVPTGNARQFIRVSGSWFQEF